MMRKKLAAIYLLLGVIYLGGPTSYAEDAPAPPAPEVKPEIKLETVQVSADKGMRTITTGDINTGAIGETQYVYTVSMAADLNQVEGKEATRLGRYDFELYIHEPQGGKNKVELELGFLFFKDHWPTKAKAERVQAALNMELGAQDLAEIPNTLNDELAAQAANTLHENIVGQMKAFGQPVDDAQNGRILQSVFLFAQASLKNASQLIPAVITEWSKQSAGNG